MTTPRNSGVPRLVLFPCSDEVGRAQLAVAWFRSLADPAKARAVLAGSPATRRILPDLPQVMRDHGLDLSSLLARALTRELMTAADLVVTMDGTFARRVLGRGTPIRREHWLVPSAGAAGDREQARALCDLIRSRVAMLVFSEGWARANVSYNTARVTLSHHRAQLGAAL